MFMRRGLLAAAGAAEEAAFVGAYDTIPNIAAAYGMRRLLSSYTSNLLRLRRLSDSAVQDFGYVANGDLDTAAIATFIGASSGHVVTWYDQSGNGLDATNATPATQPQYTAVSINALPSISFTVTNNFLRTTSFTAMPATTICATAKIGAFLGSSQFLCDGSSTTNRNAIFKSAATGAFAIFSGTVRAGSAVDTRSRTFAATFNGTDQLFIDSGAADVSADSGDQSLTQLTIGNNQSAPVINQWNGPISEFVLFDAVLSGANIGLARQAQIDYYGEEHFPLVTPTHDGSGQTVHPSVFDAGEGNVWPASGSPQHRYWMAITPYPNGDAAHEDPNILVSDDRVTWTVPTGLTNPIDNLGATPHNADTEILHGEDDSLYCYYIDSGVAGYNMNVRSSADGVTWSSETVLFSGSYASSPTVFHDGSQYVMIYVDFENVPYVLRYRTCATPDGTWSAESNITLNGTPTDTHPWNIFARKISDGSYLALIHFPPSAAPHRGGSLYWATSSDGATWTVGSVEIATGDYPFIAGSIYRSCFIEVASGEYWIWFSGSEGETSGPWRTGLKHVPA